MYSYNLCSIYRACLPRHASTRFAWTPVWGVRMHIVSDIPSWGIQAAYTSCMLADPQPRPLSQAPLGAMISALSEL